MRVVAIVATAGLVVALGGGALAADEDAYAMPPQGVSPVVGDVRVSGGVEDDGDRWIDAGARLTMPLFDAWWLQPDLYLYHDSDADTHFAATAHVYKQVTATKVAGLFAGFITRPGDYSAFYVGAEAEHDIAPANVLGGRVHVAFPDYANGGWLQGAAWLTHYFYNDNARVTGKFLGWLGFGVDGSGAEFYLTAAKRLPMTTLDGFIEGSIGTNNSGNWAAARVGLEYAFGIPGATMRQSKQAVRFQPLEWP